MRRRNTFSLNCLSGAPVEWWVRQNLDNFLTNVHVLSSFCPRFVKVLSMSNICQKNFNFTKFCQIIVHILSKKFGNRLRFFLKYISLSKVLCITQT